MIKTQTAYIIFFKINTSSINGTSLIDISIIKNHNLSPIKKNKHNRKKVKYSKVTK